MHGRQTVLKIVMIRGFLGFKNGEFHQILKICPENTEQDQISTDFDKIFQDRFSVHSRQTVLKIATVE